MKYAHKTTVSPEKSRAEIEAIVKRYGAKGFMVGWHDANVRIEFLCRDRHVRFVMTEPPELQGKRQKWRSLTLLVKAKLEAVDAKIATFEEAFLSDIVMPDGQTVWEKTREPIKLAYQTRAPVNLLGPPA